MSQALHLTVGAKEGGIRADRWLSDQVPEFTRHTAQRLCAAGKVRQNGRILKKSDPMLPGATITVDAAESDHAVEAPELQLTIVRETKDWVVVNKAAGIACAATYAHARGTLAGALVARYPSMRQVGYGPRDPGLVHRLDTYTSGLIVAARNQHTFLQLKHTLTERSWDKRYLALVEPRTLPEAGECTLSLGPDPKNQRRVRVDSQKGKACYSTFQVLQRGTGADLVEVCAKTAYRHQVRAHLAALGAPLLGDEIYGGLPGGLAPRHALHASYIAIPIADFGIVTSDLPDDLRVLLDES